MGFRFRKSVNFGPFRLNFSKSGVGYSVGGKGARLTKKAKGGFRATASAPGTGLSFTKDFGGGKSGGKKQPSASASSGQQSAPSGNPKKPKKQYTLGEALAALFLLFLVAIAASCSNDTAEPADQVDQPAASIEQVQESAQEPLTAKEDGSYSLDYSDAESFESALNKGEKVSGKIVQFVVKKYVPDAKVGINCQAGEHLNFISDSGLDVSAGNIVVGQITEEPSTLLGSWIIPYNVLTINVANSESAETPLQEEPEKGESEPTEQTEQQQEEPEPVKQTEQSAEQTEPTAQPEQQQPEQTEPAAQPEQATEQSEPAAQPEQTEPAAPAAAVAPVVVPSSQPEQTAPPAEQQPEPAAQAESSDVAYVLNTDSKKFHYPDCSSAEKISPENYATCNSREEAIAMGYEPCGRCKP